MAQTSDRELKDLIQELTFESPVKMPTRRETTRRSMKTRNFRRENSRSFAWDGFFDVHYDEETYFARKHHTERKRTRRNKGNEGDADY